MPETLPQLDSIPTDAGVPGSGSSKRHVAVVTGTRAEFGLLRPVIDAIRTHAALRASVVAAGAHLLKPAETVREVAKRYDIAFTVPMQTDGDVGRVADARALGRGVAGFTEAFLQLQPDWVLVLGDRIEAFAAAASASVGGWSLAHIHGGDRAEGVADEAMRHAITKLAHLHLAASEESAERIIRMGEPRELVHMVGSPAISELLSIQALDDRAATRFGDPDVLLLLHPVGREDAVEHADTMAAIEGIRRDRFRRVLAIEPNHDPGRRGVMQALAESGLQTVAHLERSTFIGLLRRATVLVGNSSAGLIEAAAVGCPVVNIGPRQAGRFATQNVISVLQPTPDAVDRAIRQALHLKGQVFAHPYGRGDAEVRIAHSLARVNPHDPALLRKRNSY